MRKSAFVLSVCTLFVLTGCRTNIDQKQQLKIQGRLAASATATVLLHCADSPAGYTLAVAAAEHEIRELDARAETQPEMDLVAYLSRELPSAAARFNLEHMNANDVTGPSCPQAAADIEKHSTDLIAKF